MLTVNDLLYRYLQGVLPASVQADSSSITPGSLKQGVTTEDSLFASASVTGPAANTIIAATGAVSGLYQISGQVMYTGTAPVDAAETGNMRISIGANAKHRVWIPPVLNLPVDFNLGVFRANAESIRISARLLATATVVYNATIVATKIGD